MKKVEKKSPINDQFSVITSLDRRVQHKTHRWTGEKWNTTAHSKARDYSHELVAFTGVSGLYQVLSELENQPYKALIRGELFKEKDPREVRRSHDYYYAVDRHWVQVDIDECKTPFAVDFQDAKSLEQAALWVRDRFLQTERITNKKTARKAKELCNVQCVAQWSASAFLSSEENGQKYDPYKAKLHLWFLFDRPVCNQSLVGWLDEIGVDKAQGRTVQSHYVCAPTFFSQRGVRTKDHLAWRTRLLAGNRETIKTPSELLNTAQQRAKNEEQRKQDEARQEELRRVAKETGITEFSEGKAFEYLDAAKDKILSAPKGHRHATLFGQARWIGQVVAGDNGLRYHDAKASLESAGHALFGNEYRTEQNTVKDGLDRGMQDTPFIIRRKLELPKAAQEEIQPETSKYRTLTSLRPALADEISLALSRTGTTVLVAPTGGGKTYATIKTLIERHSDKVILWTCPTIKERERIAQEFRKAGQACFEAKARDPRTCANLRNYRFAASLEKGKGAVWCKEICPHNVKNGGTCRPPRVPRQTRVVVTTHALSKYMSEVLEPEIMVWDEGATIQHETATSEELGQAVARGEIQGETTDKLLALVSESHGRKVKMEEVQEAVAGLEFYEPVEGEKTVREQAFSEMCFSGSRPQDANFLDWRALEALKTCANNGGKGAYIYNNTLHIPSQSEVPNDAPTRLFLDATATRLASQALYGEHTWRCLKLEPSEHTTHVHILGNGGKSVRSQDGTFEVKRIERLLEGLEQVYPKALQVQFKDWMTNQAQDENQAIYFGGVDAKGSNKYESLEQVIAMDWYVPKEAKQTLILNWIEARREQGFPEPTKEELEQFEQEATYQLELSPMIQAIGRIRPYSATKENPKLIITIGKNVRLPKLANKTKVMQLDEALFQLRGELSQRLAAKLLPQIAAKKGGIWLSELDSPLVYKFLNDIKDNSTWHKLPNIYKGKDATLRCHRFIKGICKSTLKSAWKNLKLENKVLVYPKGKAQYDLSYLPPSRDDFSGIAERARREGWKGWSIYDRESRLLERVDNVEQSLLCLPVSFAYLSFDDFVTKAAEVSGHSVGTIRRKIKALGGIRVLRSKLEEQEAVKVPEVTEEISQVILVPQVTQDIPWQEEPEQPKEEPKEQPKEQPQEEPEQPKNGHIEAKEEPEALKDEPREEQGFYKPIERVYLAYNDAWTKTYKDVDERFDCLMKVCCETAQKEGIQFSDFHKDLYPLLAPYISGKKKVMKRTKSQEPVQILQQATTPKKSRSASSTNDERKYSCSPVVSDQQLVLW